MYKLYKLYRTHQEKALTLADQALVSGTNFISSLVFARLLGLESYGTFVLGWMIVLFASTFQQAFIFSPMANINAALPEQKQKEYTDRLFTINLLLASACTILIMALAYLLNDLSQAGCPPEILYSFPLVTFAYLNYDFFRKRLLLHAHSKCVLVLDGLFPLLLSISLYTLYQSNAISVASIVCSIAICYLILTAVAFFVSETTIHFLHISTAVMKEHWLQGKWLVATALLQWFSGNYFLIAAASILGSREIGIIRIAQNIVGVLNILFIAMESYIPISASKLFYQNGTRSLFQYLKQVTIKGLLVTTTCCFLIAFFAKPIVQHLYGIEYVGYSFIVQAFALFYILVFLAIPLRFAIRTMAHNHHIFIGYLISATFSLFSAAAIIHRYGLNGVLIGIFATQVLTQVWYVFSLKNYFYEYYSFSTWKS